MWQVRFRLVRKDFEHWFQNIYPSLLRVGTVIVYRRFLLINRLKQTARCVRKVYGSVKLGFVSGTMTHQRGDHISGGRWHTSETITLQVGDDTPVGRCHCRGDDNIPLGRWHCRETMVRQWDDTPVARWHSGGMITHQWHDDTAGGR